MEGRCGENGDHHVPRRHRELSLSITNLFTIVSFLETCLRQWNMTNYATRHITKQVSIGSKNTYVFTNNKLFANHIGIFVIQTHVLEWKQSNNRQKTYSSVLFLAGEVPPWVSPVGNQSALMSHGMRKHVCHMRTTMAQISLSMRSQISAFIVRCLDSIIVICFKTLASICSWAGQFESFYWVANSEERFSRDEAHFIMVVW